MITRIEIKNFRGFASESIDLSRLTLLVGRNGAGKSTVIDVLRFVRDALATSLDDALLSRHGLAALRRWSPTRPYDVEILLTFGGARLYGQYGMALTSRRDGSFEVKWEAASISSIRGGEPVVFSRFSNAWQTMPDGTGASRPKAPGGTTSLDPLSLALPALAITIPEFARLRTFLRSLCFYSIYPNTLREPQKPSASRVLDDHGSNLSSGARLIKDAQHTRLVRAINEVAGGVKGIRVEQAAGYLVTRLQRTLADGKTAWFDLSQESDGTLRMLGLLVALYQPAPLRFIAIEEPELTLHPGALGLLSDILLEASAERQLLVTTQSPDLISRFCADSLRVVERVNGLSHVGPVSETQRKAIEAQLFTSGDLLRMEGLKR